MAAGGAAQGAVYTEYMTAGREGREDSCKLDSDSRVKDCDCVVLGSGNIVKTA